MILKRATIFLFIGLLSFFVSGQNKISKDDKIEVLNFATIHLTNSSDANTSFVDINNPKVQKDINKIVEKLVEFNPTIICVEVPAQETLGTDRIYQKYKLDQSNKTNWSEEINAIAFEVGRLSDVEKIYGIDSKLGFNYPKLMELAEKSDSESTRNFLKESEKKIQRFMELSLLEKYKELNTKEWKSETFNFYNFLATMHTPNNFEGANIIADFYKRNLRIYSNFADIPKNPSDRILIILGGTHTAYLDIFLKNNPKFKLLDPKEFTNY